MKYVVVALRDKKLQAFQAPQIKVEDLDHITQMTARSLRLVRPEEKARAKDMALYHLGEFDDETGFITSLAQPSKLLDFEDYIPRDEEDGKDSKETQSV